MKLFASHIAIEQPHKKATLNCLHERADPQFFTYNRTDNPLERFNLKRHNFIQDEGFPPKPNIVGLVTCLRKLTNKIWDQMETARKTSNRRPYSRRHGQSSESTYYWPEDYATYNAPRHEY